MTDPRPHLLELTRPHRRRIAAATVLSIFQSLLLLPVPLLLGYAFDTALPDEDFTRVAAAAAGITAAVLASGMLQVTSMNLQVGVATRIGEELRSVLYRRVFSAPRSLFDHSLVSTVHDRLVNDSLRTVYMFGSALNKLVPDVIITVGVAVILVVLEWRLALVTLGFIPLLLVVSRFMVKRQKPAVQRFHDLFREFSSRVMLILRSQDLIRISGAEDRELRAAEAELAELRVADHRFEFIAAAHNAAQRAVIGMAGAVILVAGGWLVIEEYMGLGELLAFYAAFALLRDPAGRTASAVGELIAGWHAFGRIVEFLDDPMEQPYRGSRQIDLQGELALDDVSFGYDDEKPVLRDFSLHLRPGTVTALIGPNGSGKSTVVNLLLGFYRPDRGEVRADGVDFDDLELHRLRAQMGVVRQDTFMLPGTILENVTYGDETDAETLDRALALSGADAVVAAMPRGLHTVVGEDGQLLSGGQRQRIAIARALVGDPRVLILDEPTNHLDERAIGELLHRILGMRESMAVLLISHQRAVTDLADEVVELEG